MDSNLIQASKYISIDALKSISLCASHIEVVEQKWLHIPSYSGYVKNGRLSNGIITICSDMEFHYRGDGFSFCAHNGDTILMPRGIKYDVKMTGNASNTSIDSYTVNFLLHDENGIEKIPDIKPGIICRNPEILSAVTNLSIDCHAITPNYFKVMSDFFHLFHCVTQGLEERNEDFYPIRRSIDFINSRWNKNDTIYDIASASNMSVGHLQRLFKSWSGLSPIAYRSMLRINHAKTMLRDTELSVSSISYTIGFEDPLYFSKVFHKATGLSPRQYRKKQLCSLEPDI